LRILGAKARIGWAPSALEVILCYYFAQVIRRKEILFGLSVKVLLSIVRRKRKKR